MVWLQRSLEVQHQVVPNGQERFKTLDVLATLHLLQMRVRCAVRLMRISAELPTNQEDNLMSSKQKTMLRQTLTHDRETPGQVALGDFQQRFRKLRVQGAMPTTVAHGKRTEARFIGLDGEDERAGTFRFLA